jgi:hypothetical protein
VIAGHDGGDHAKGLRALPQHGGRGVELDLLLETLFGVGQRRKSLLQRGLAESVLRSKRVEHQQREQTGEQQAADQHDERGTTGNLLRCKDDELRA